VFALTDSLITLLGVRKYTTDCFPEGKMLALLLHDFVVDGVTERTVTIVIRGPPRYCPWELTRDLF
jgi:hypothetical protein